MELTTSMFATQVDYWKARAELAESTVQELANELCCEPDNEVMLAEVSRLRGIGGEPMRVIAVESIRAVTGCPDIKAPYGDRYLVDVLMATTQQWVTSNAIGQRGAASGASDAPTGCASNGDTEEE